MTHTVANPGAVMIHPAKAQLVFTLSYSTHLDLWQSMHCVRQRQRNCMCTMVLSQATGPTRPHGVACVCMSSVSSVNVCVPSPLHRGMGSHLSTQRLQTLQ